MKHSAVLAGITILAASLLGGVSASAQETRCGVFTQAPGAGRAADLARLLESSFLGASGCGRATLKEDQPPMEDLDQRLEAIIGQVRNGRGGASFDDGAKAVQGIYLESKAYLPFIRAEVLAKLYKVMAMVQLELDQQGLAQEYLSASLNADPSQTPLSFAYSQKLKDFHGAQAAALLAAAKNRVRIDTVPAGAQVTVDGRPAGQTPLDLEVAAGPHLVQIQKEGYKSTGWIKAGAEAPWSFKLAPLPGLDRLEKSRDQVLAALAPKKGRGKAPVVPACPEKELNTLEAMLQTDRLLVALVEEKDGQMLVTACVKAKGPATQTSAQLAIDGSLPAKLKEQFTAAPAAPAQAPAAEVPTATIIGKSALPPVLEKIHRTRAATTEFYEVLMARQRAFRDHGFVDQVKRLDTIKSGVVGILKDLDEAEAIYPKDLRKAARLEAKATELWNRMSDTVLSVRSMEVQQKMAEQLAKESKPLTEQCQGSLASLAQRWKKDGRKVKDRAFQKAFSKALADLQKAWPAKPPKLRRGQTPPPPPSRAQLLQCRIDLSVLTGQLEQQLNPPAPPKPVEPAVEPEPAGRR